MGLSIQSCVKLRCDLTWSYLSDPDILVELRRTLTYKLQLSPERVSAILAHVYRIAEQVEPREHISGVLRDADDHIILACAVECHADCIVTSDRGMLRLKTFRGIAIVHPSMMKFINNNHKHK